MTENENKPDNKKSGEKKKKSIFHRTVNVFLYFVLAVLFLLLVVIGITQTSLFKDYAREIILEEVNKSLNGTLYFEKLEGTIFTSVIIRNASLALDKDTLLKASVIEVKTSPLQLLLKKIFIRKVEIRDARINLIVEEDGSLNISRLVPPSPEDTTTSAFPFKINVADLSLKNISFNLQRYDYKGSVSNYDYLFFDDLRIDNLNLSLSAYADIDNNDFEAALGGFSMNTNVNGFSIKDIRGDIKLNREGMSAEDFILRTGKSDITLDASLSDINIFDSTADISHALISLDLKADKFDFTDLRTFVPSVDIFDDAINFTASASGSLKELEINKIKIDYLSTNLIVTGKITDVIDPDNMKINAVLDGSQVFITDINKLMPSLALPPEFAEAGIVKFDTLRYTGSIYSFNTNVFLRSDAGNLQASGLLDYGGEDLVYDLNFRTNNFNIHPFAGMGSDINSSGKIKGSGTDPSGLNTYFEFNAGSSEILGNRISDLKLKTDAKNSLINYSIFAVKDNSEIQLDGFFDFTNEDNPSYELKGSGKSINIVEFTGDTSLVSDLNFTMNAAGESFDPDNMDISLTINIFDSKLNGNNIDSTRAVIDIGKDNSGERVINVISDIADISVSGNFSFKESLGLIDNEISLLSTIINEKLNEIIPVKDTLIITTVRLAKGKALDLESLPSTKIKYMIDLKDFSLASLFLKNTQLDIRGKMSGDITNTGDNIYVNLNIDIDFVKYRTQESVMFISGLDLRFNLGNDIHSRSFENISSELKLKVDRIFAGEDIRNLNLNLRIKDNSSYFSFAGDYGKIASARLIGGFSFPGEEVNLALDTVRLRYNDLNILNKRKISLTYSKDGIEFRDFVLARNGGEIDIKGSLAKAGSQDLSIDVKNIYLSDILKNALNAGTGENFNAVLNLNAHITGSMESPLVDLKMEVDSINYSGKHFGSLFTEGSYSNRSVNFNIWFEEVSTLKKALLVKGYIPVDLSFAGGDNSNIEPGPMNVSLIADNFNLGAFGDILPQVNKVSGFFTADVNITGTTENLQPEGYIALRNVSFVSEMNNLTYSAGLRVNLKGNEILIDTILIQNGPDVPDGGTISGNGKVVIDGLDFKTVEISVGGRLKLLSENSRYANTPVYGDLIIRTKENIRFRMDDEGMSLNASISVRHANLTIPPSPGAYQNTNRSFVYKFVQDTAYTAVERMDFESLVAYSEKLSGGKTQSAKKSDFNYSIELDVENEARIVFVLSKEINQNLTAVLNGNVLYESIGGHSDIQGELKLLEGSTLEFIKTFKAEGSIRFESDIANPYLNITASYVDYYYPADSTSSLNEVLVGVKIKVNGLLNDLDKNFVKEENNIAVYYGEESIEKDEPDPTKDASDAIMFIITGRFTEDLNQRERSAATDQFTGTATSIAGSVIGGVLNRYFGEYVSGVELRRVGSETRFVFSGRAGSFRYQLGGSENVFQNISQANLRIEYPVYKGLSLRFERREDVRERSVINEMINELGLRYSFEF